MAQALEYVLSLFHWLCYNSSGTVASLLLKAYHLPKKAEQVLVEREREIDIQGERERGIGLNSFLELISFGCLTNPFHWLRWPKKREFLWICRFSDLDQPLSSSAELSSACA